MSDVTVHLIRHAKAESRSAWTTDDSLRPLSDKGLRQSAALADQCADLGLRRVLSSPAVRCRQTVEPLAERIGVPVEDAAELAEGAALGPALALLAGLTVEAALSSHGDLIPEIVDHLAAEGMRLEGPDRCQKASIWTLERSGGRFVVGRYSPPP